MFQKPFMVIDMSLKAVWFCLKFVFTHTFLARILQKWYISDTICKNLASIFTFQANLSDSGRSDISCKILQDQTFFSKFFQGTCKNNALSSKILEVKSDRFLQKMYGSSTCMKNNFDLKFSVG